jgi:type IV pilus biogenesis protein CpaD/CtpE
MINIAKEDKSEEFDLDKQQSQALNLMEQRKNVERLFENQELNQASSLEIMIKEGMQNKMNQKISRLAKEIAKEKK